MPFRPQTRRGETRRRGDCRPSPFLRVSVSPCLRVFCRHREAIFDDGNEGRFNQLVHEFRRGVERTRCLPLRTEDQVEAQSPHSLLLTPHFRNVGVKFEEAFVNRAEFLDVEGGVVDAAGRRALAFPVVGQIPEGGEEVAVAQRASVEGLRGEQFAVERGNVEDGGELVVAEQLPKGAQAQPQVGVVGPGGAHVEQAAEAGDAVVVAIDGIGADEAAVFGDQQEQEPVNQPEQLAVELGGGEFGK